MPKPIQLDLFTEPTFLRTVERKLPGTDYVTTTDVALAFGVSDETVRRWIAIGRLEAANYNTGADKIGCYRITREAAISLARRLANGI